MREPEGVRVRDALPGPLRGSAPALTSILAPHAALKRLVRSSLELGNRMRLLRRHHLLVLLVLLVLLHHLLVLLRHHLLMLPRILHASLIHGRA